MKFIKPKTVGELKIHKMMAGNFAVMNGVKNSASRICIPCRSPEHGNEIIEKIKNANPGEMLHI